MDYAKEFQRALHRRGYHDATVMAIAAGAEPPAVYAVDVPAGRGGGPLRLQGTVGELGYRIARLPRRRERQRPGNPDDRPREHPRAGRAAQGRPPVGSRRAGMG